MELGEIYDDDTLDMFIGTAVDEGKMDIKSFRTLLREYNSGIRQLHAAGRETASPARVPDSGLLARDCSYYEEYAKEACHAGDSH